MVGLIHYLTDCLVIFVKGFIGMILWSLFAFALSSIALFFHKYKNRGKEKPLYQGQPIVIKGGKSSAKDGK